ncbi:MAG: PTS mannose/fructose/sorbose/N-acetylgalactosamine transporter subunit IIC [Holdemania massiliensis]
MTLIQALLIALVAALGQAAGDIGGNVMVNRPIVLAPIVGAILGDLQQGLMMGAALELIFLGVVSIGGATPSDANMGSVLGTAFAMSMHQGVEIALALAVPIGILQQMVKYLVYFFRATTMHKVEEFAEAGDFGKITRFHFGHCACMPACTGLIAFVSLQFGASAMQTLVEKIPAIIITGLGATSQMLPAGLLLMNMLWDNRLCVFLFFGFILSVYLNLPIIAIAGIALTIGVIMIVQDISANRGQRTAVPMDAKSEEEAFFNE